MRTIKFILALLFIPVLAKAQSTEDLYPVTTKGELHSKNAASRSETLFSEPGFTVFPLTVPMFNPDQPYSDPDCEADEDEKEEDENVYKIKQELKKAANALRDIAEASGAPVADPFAPSVAITPTVVSSWNATHVGAGSPPDNTMAISNAGYLVVCVNSRLAIYNSSGTVLGQWEFANLFNGTNLAGFFFDPNVIYDPQADRFVFTCSVSDASPRLLVASASGSNPLGGWTVRYIVPPAGFWLDYPRIGVSTDDIFISCSKINMNYQYQGTILYQIIKSTVYSNTGTATFQTWNNLQGNPIALTPVSSGNGTNFGPGIYLIAHNHVLGTSTKLYRITNNMSSSNETMTYSSVSSTPYDLAAEASQLGTSEKLDVGDSRALSTFIVNGTIHYVFSGAISTATGFSRIFYHRLNPTNLTQTNKQIAATGYSMSFPSVAWSATSATDKSVVIAFQYCNSTKYPSVAAVHVDDAMTPSSWVTTAVGTGYITTGGTPVSRWGDYTYLCRKQNSSPVRIWGAISFGNTLHEYTDKVFQLKVGTALDDSEDRTNEFQESTAPEVEIYPNPAINGGFQVNIRTQQSDQYSIQLTDITGRLILNDDKAEISDYFTHFEVNTNTISPGLYFVSVLKNRQPFFSEKMVIPKK